LQLEVNCSLTTDSSGDVIAETRYLPYGEEHWITGTLVTDFTFTGQRAERGFALMDYNARYYDPWLGRFVNADTVVPQAGNPQALNRYAYTVNNPLKYIDSSGNCHGLSGAAFDACAKIVLTLASAVHEANQWADSLVSFMDPSIGDSTLDAVGWRAEGSAGVIVGGDLNVDVVMKLPKDLVYDTKGLHYEKPGSIDVFTGYGVQGADVGAGVSTGPLFIYNLPSLDDYTGTTDFVGVSASWESGAEGNVFWADDLNSEDTRTWGWHVGIGAGVEIFAGGGVSKTEYLEDFYTDTLVPRINRLSDRLLGQDVLPPKEPWFWEKGTMRKLND
jgi:RHS repeat-associated protein